MFELAKLIEQLDLAALAPGRHALRFVPLTMGNGQSWQLPVLVLKGSEPGPRVWIVAGTHGDELNGVLTAQRMGRELSPEGMSGTLVILPSLNLPGMLQHSRDFIPSDPDSSPVNLNRLFPGKADGSSAERYLHAIWQRLLMGNADYVLDLHTQTRGASYPLYVFADYRIEAVRAMALQIGADAILDDPGEAGVLESELNRAGIPCITLEVGSGKVIEPELIDRAVTGLRRVLGHLGLISPCPAAQNQPVEGTQTTTIRADLGGMALPQVRLGQRVVTGELLSIQYDPFGQEARRYHAPCDGWVLSLNTDPLREPGTLLARLLH
ncbi:succinylglutamate desuccinylase/aspartoacylase family protein [Ferrimonas marina]|uniref:Succinylglutamate desuccinylase/Aspartoacylase catalytic domain-containing protein n=1 Tax=Ferrimonas marina TaxID=299255 RepID=A0A1M5ZF49_9GAMM|nr:succinylglutamate desuccinylase/aspartoacylase family protein [Ferrimonas marina]SHI22814.1 hypothetical protein SAMN02745129_0196 [Ferrimonas marina]